MEKGLTSVSTPEVSEIILDDLQNIPFSLQTDPPTYVIISMLQKSYPAQ